MGYTRKEFGDIFNQHDSCYIYYLDGSLHMHFLADADSVNLDASELNDAIYTDNLSDAVLTSYEGAKALVFLCNYLFPKHIHNIVRVSSSVEFL